MELNAIFSVAKVKNFPSGFVLGSKDDLIVRNSTDMSIFKSKTMGHTLIMGRKTFESLGSKTLKGRKSIVISSMPVNDWKKPKDCMLARDLNMALDIAENDFNAERAFVIGGANLIREAMTKCNFIYYTVFNYQHEFQDDDVLMNMQLLTGTNFFSMFAQKELREQCTIVATGEKKMLKFKMISLKPTKDFKEDVRGRSDAKKIGNLMRTPVL